MQPSSAAIYRAYAIVMVEIVLFAAMLAVLWLARDVIILVIFSLILASALYPPVAWLKQRHFPSHLSILAFYLLVVSLLGGIGYVAASTILDEGQQFIQHAPFYSDMVRDWIERLPFSTPLKNLADVTTEQLNAVARHGVSVLQSALDYLKTLFSGLMGIVTVLVITFYLLVDIEHLERVVMLLVPDNQRDTLCRVLKRIAGRTGAYVRGQLLLMLVIGLAVWLGLSLIGVRYAFLLGVMAFFLEIIPIVGPLVSAVVGVLVALAQDPMRAVWALVLYLLVQQLENYILVPRIMGNALHLSPLWVLVAILMGASVAGVVGVLLSLPMAVMMHTLVGEYYVRQTLGREPDALPGE